MPELVDDLFINGAVGLATVPPEAMSEVVMPMAQFALDFDDAYQYVAAEQADASIVSFDKDFDRVEQGRITPQAVISSQE